MSDSEGGNIQYGAHTTKPMQEQHSRKAEGEKEFEPEEEEEAKGNSVFDAPVTNLAAGLQLGFTPSTAGTQAPVFSCPVSLWQLHRPLLPLPPPSSPLDLAHRMQQRLNLANRGVSK